MGRVQEGQRSQPAGGATGLNGRGGHRRRDVVDSLEFGVSSRGHLQEFFTAVRKIARRAIFTDWFANEDLLELMKRSS